MACIDHRYQHLLADAIMDRLPDGEMHMVCDHLKQCAECRQSYRAGALIANRDPEVLLNSLEGHILDDTLMQYYANRSSLTATKISAIRAHLESCPDCRGELQILEQVEQDLLRVASAPQAKHNKERSVRERCRFLLLHPVFAAAVLIIIAMPVFFLWQGEEDKTGSSTRSFPPANELRETNRSAGGVQVVSMLPTDDYLYLRIPYPHQASIRHYSVTISRDQDPKAAPSLVWLRYPQAGKIDALIEAVNLSEGRYDLQVLDVGNDAPVDTLVTTFVFNLEIRD